MAQPTRQIDWEVTLSDTRAIPTRKRIDAMQIRLAEIEVKRAALLAQGDLLVAQFKAKYPDSPAYLVRYADRTLSDYRWRLSGSAKWRHTGQPGNKVAVELTGDIGQRILSTLPLETREDWLRFETQR